MGGTEVDGVVGKRRTRIREERRMLTKKGEIEGMKGGKMGDISNALRCHVPLGTREKKRQRETKREGKKKFQVSVKIGVRGYGVLILTRVQEYRGMACSSLFRQPPHIYKHTWKRPPYCPITTIF